MDRQAREKKGIAIDDDGLPWNLRPESKVEVCRLLVLLGATRTLLGAPGIATRSKGLTTSNKKLVETRISN